MDTWLLISLIILPFLGTAAIAGVSAAPWVPTRKRERDNLLSNITFRTDATVIDLGCGSGDLLFALAKRYPKMRCVGYDISLFPLCIAWMRQLIGGHKNISIRFGNLYKQTLHEADVIFLFLMPSSYKKLLPYLQQQAPDKATIILEAWPFEGIEPLEVIKQDKTLPLFIYKGSQLQNK